MREGRVPLVQKNRISGLGKAQEKKDPQDAGFTPSSSITKTQRDRQKLFLNLRHWSESEKALYEGNIGGNTAYSGAIKGHLEALKSNG